MFLNYGGHEMAAGVVIKPEYIDKANKLFNDACKKYYDIHGKPKEIQYYDVIIEPKHITENNARMLLDTLYPYCTQFNPEPVFCIKDATITDAKLLEDKNKTYRLLSFNLVKDNKKTSIAFKMFTDDYGTEVDGLIADVYFSFPQVIQEGKAQSYNRINVLDIDIKE